jgi:hypothetical protein
MSNASGLECSSQIVTEQIDLFPESRLLRRINEATVRIGHYHAILTTLFQQTYAGPYSFARAAVNCGWRHGIAKEYLLRHAEEERTHWRWVLDDLRNTGYIGQNPREVPPHPSCQAFIGLLCYVAEHEPIARLAIAAVLEGIGATHGGPYGRKFLQALGLIKSCATFFLSHAETDVGHTAEISEMLAASPMNENDWRWMNHAARCAGQFYRGMYNHEAFA